MPRRPSSIEKLPDDLRKEINRLLRERRMTLVQITEYVRTAGGAVSKSGVHRYAQELDKVSEAVDLGVEIAKRLGRDLDDGETSARFSEGAALGLETIIIRGVMQMQQGDEVDTKALHDVANSYRAVASGRKSNLDTEYKIRDRYLKKAAAAAETVGRKHGITQATVDEIRASILGIDARPA